MTEGPLKNGETTNPRLFRFVHQQRTAGLSMKLALLYRARRKVGAPRPLRTSWNLWGNVVSPEQEAQLKGAGRRGERDFNLPARCIKERHPELWDEAYTFSIVRNPYPRVYSMYYHRMQHRPFLLHRSPGNRAILHAAGRAAAMTFPEWVEEIYTKPASERIKPLQGALRGPAGWTLPQWDWISSAEGEVIVDFVGRFETLEGSFQTIQSQIGSSRTLAQANGHPDRPPYQEAYTEKTIELIRNAYAIDFEKFNYDVAFS